MREQVFMLLEVASIATGAYLVVSGVLTQIARRRRAKLEGPTELRWLARSFRRIVFGLALAGVGSGLMADIPWLVTLSLIIGGEEVLESSVISAALRDEELRRAKEAGTGFAAPQPAARL
jgi:hypothetical protein